MQTEILDAINGDYSFAVQKAAEILKSGGIVGIPTETVYGLAASAYDDAAIAKVFAAKGRPQDNPLIVHISDMEMLSSVATDIPESAYKMAKAFWPGPFTMVLKKTSAVAQSVSRGLDTVAVRMPCEKTAHDIIKVSGLPLAAPSANISGAPSPTTANHVINDLSGKIDAVVVGNDCEVGVESTVVLMVGEHPRLLRPGAVTLEQLKEIAPDIVVDKAILNQPEKDEKVSSPGMKYKHYAPKTETYLVEGDFGQFCDFVNSKTDCVAVCFEEEAEKIAVKKLVYGSKSSPETLAKNVFSVLRDVDKLNVKKVFVHAPAKTGVELAVYNRLIRAAAFKVVEL